VAGYVSHQRITSPAVVVAAHLRHPLYLSDRRRLYELETDGGRYLAVAPPDIFDAFGRPITLAAELAAGSVVRVSLVAGLMHAIQVVHARYADPFRGSP
jgi:hypothetical protein